MSAKVPRSVQMILFLVEPLVPRHRRRAWRDQWEADLEHMVACGRPVIRIALGTFAHALYLRREEGRLRGLISDLRHSVRVLARRPGFSLLAVLTLGVGIGSATAVFSIAEAVLLRPLPLDQHEQLVRIFNSQPSAGLDRFSVSYPNFEDYSARVDLFQSSSFYQASQWDLSGGGDPERVNVTRVGPDYFETLRGGPVIGRLLQPDDLRLDSEPTVVLSEDLWIRRFGADSTVLGRTVRMEGRPYTVVGVLNRAHSWPLTSDAWIPLRWGGTPPERYARRINHTWQMVARLQPDVDVRTASEQVRAMTPALYADIEDERTQGIQALAVGLGRSVSGVRGPTIIATMGAAVLLVLLIACLNASGLLLTHTMWRARELSLRAALGAGRGRLLTLLLGESVILSLAGGAVGIGIAFLALREGVKMAPRALPGLDAIELNATVALVALGLSLTASLVAGILPAWKASRTSVAEELKEAGAQASESRAGKRLRQVLVVTELALSMALLAGAGLMITGFRAQLASDAGFDRENLLTFTVRLPRARYSGAMIRQFFDEAEFRLQSLPGVVTATSTSQLPLGAGGSGLIRGFVFEGAPTPPEGTAHLASWVEVSPEYFHTLGIRPVQGRVFTEDDRADVPLVAIVNESMARTMAPGEEIVGRVIRSHYDENLPRTVVGVVQDLQLGSLAGREELLVLVPAAQAVRAAMAFMVRTTGDPTSTMAAVRRTMTGLDSDVALDDLRTLENAHRARLAGIRFITALFGAFGALALLLAGSGVYGLVSFSVSQRTREIGIRMAIGASSASVQRGVLAEGAWLAAVGVGVGLVLAMVLARVMDANLFGLGWVRPSTFVQVAVLLSAATLAASYLPARRVTQVDPVASLRAD